MNVRIVSGMLVSALVGLGLDSSGSLLPSSLGQQSGQSPVGAAETIDFARDILPLLSDRCFLCHGPDAGQRASELRLDQQASAYALAIVPGDPANSELLRRITSEDAEQVMPPPDSNLRLTGEEKNLLRDWIAQGGHYAEHWAFEPPRRPPLPQTLSPQWARGPLDLFVQRQLERQSLSPSPPAPPETLIRRLSYDLNGLPPTPSQIDAFLADYARQPAAAYERLVDRLLADSRFGERIAVDWLDAARYADTYGYQNDRYRPMWPWRDWVVEAFNENLPYDDFITWQLAGDLLPQATRQQILATAFNRNHRQTNEGGSVEEEFRLEYIADRVNTLGTAFLGLTLECCRCHDHKYDPLTQADYYRLSAFFNSIDESGLYSHFTDATPTPTLLLASERETEQLDELAVAIAAKERQCRAWSAEDAAAFDAWRARLESPPPNGSSAGTGPDSLRQLVEQALTEALIGDFPLEQNESGKLRNRVDQELSGSTSVTPQADAGRVGQGILLSGDNNVSLQPGGLFSRNQPFTIALWLQTPRRFERAVLFHRSQAWTDSGSRGYELLIEQGKLSAALIHFWPGNALRILAQEELPLGRWNHVAMRYDGSSTAAGLSLLVNGRRIAVEVVRDGLTKHIDGVDTSDGTAASGPQELVFGQRFRDVGFKGGRIDELKVFSRDLSDLELRLVYWRDAWPNKSPQEMPQASEEELRDFFARQQLARQQSLSELRQLRNERSRMGDEIAELMVMRELPQPRPAFLMLRGAYDAPGEPVQRGLPSSILASELPPTANRLDLARWLVDPGHPLTARVAVNRFWQALFGTGLVRTAEDFGLQGASPTHPALLDWLAVEFLESGWDVKHLLRTIVMSATYRQSSDLSQRLLEHDPENLYLARGPAVRLSAEMIRDTALAASGLLVEQRGGPAVKPYQPAGLWEEKSGLAYQRDAGAGSYRRSIYSFWKRTSPPPSMMTFDASNREVCVVRRQVTLTPLQTLVLWNDPQYVEAARGLAVRSLQSSNVDAQRLAFIFRALTGRQPAASEQAVLLAMLTEQRQYFSQTPQAAELWLSVGDYRAGEHWLPNELAAWSVVASALVSYDETIMKR